MKKRIVSFAMVLSLVLCVLPLRAQAGSLSYFYKVNTYKEGLFTDVPAGQWYANDLKTAYEYGLMGGTSPTAFSPWQ